MKKLIAIIVMVAALAYAGAVTHGWIIYDNLASATTLLSRINTQFPQTSEYSGKVFPYWMKNPAAIMHYINVTNIYEETNIIENIELGSVTNITVITNISTVAEATGKYLIYVKPSIAPLLTPTEKSVVVDVLPEGCFVQEAE